MVEPCTILAGVDVDDLDPDPLHQLAAWIEAARAGGDPMPDAMCLATAGSDGAPAARMVLLRGLDDDLVFYTDYGSDKAADLEANPRAAVVLLFYAPAHRQVRVTGTVARSGAAESDRYWANRPLASRQSALVSRQSTVIASRRVLEEAIEALGDDADPPRPDRWGGYRLTPATVEFWEEGVARLHDRLRYRRMAGSWQVDRLSP